ncbi:MAG: hypothetical protein IJH37_07140 [Clostridia bacterium]|nr:hypothetical protein [Clostridia bacterium]
MRYSEPRIFLKVFKQENIQTNDIVLASAVETYADYAARQDAMAKLEKRFAQLNEITGFKF